MKAISLTDGYVSFKCPGCKGPQTIPVSGTNGWGFNADYDKPTFAPSILTRTTKTSGPFVCHSFVRNGKIEFLADCTHELKGQTVDLPDVTDESSLFYKGEVE